MIIILIEMKKIIKYLDIKDKIDYKNNKNNKEMIKMIENLNQN